MPTNENQAPPEQQREVWQEAGETAQEGRVKGTSSRLRTTTQETGKQGSHLCRYDYDQKFMRREILLGGILWYRRND